MKGLERKLIYIRNDLVGLIDDIDSILKQITEEPIKNRPISDLVKE